MLIATQLPSFGDVNTTSRISSGVLPVMLRTKAPMASVKTEPHEKLSPLTKRVIGPQGFAHGNAGPAFNVAMVEAAVPVDCGGVGIA